MRMLEDCRVTVVECAYTNTKHVLSECSLNRTCRLQQRAPHAQKPGEQPYTMQVRVHSAICPRETGQSAAEAKQLAAKLQWVSGPAWLHTSSPHLEGGERGALGGPAVRGHAGRRPARRLDQPPARSNKHTVTLHDFCMCVKSLGAVLCGIFGAQGVGGLEVALGGFQKPVAGRLRLACCQQRCASRPGR